MRGPPRSLRLLALCCAAVTSGYLWRAALEPTGRSPVVSERALGPSVPTPTVTIAPQSIRAHATPSRPAVALRTSSRVAPQRQVAFVSAAPAFAPRPTQKPTPTRPQPPTRKPPPTSGPTSQPTAATPPPTSTQPPPVASGPTSTPTPPSPQPPAVNNASGGGQTTTPDEARPGWGKGDPNHDHTGPPGHH
jgi:hypothetical protein